MALRAFRTNYCCRLWKTGKRTIQVLPMQLRGDDFSSAREQQRTCGSSERLRVFKRVTPAPRARNLAMSSAASLTERRASCLRDLSWGGLQGGKNWLWLSRTQISALLVCTGVHTLDKRIRKAGVEGSAEPTKLYSSYQLQLVNRLLDVVNFSRANCLLKQTPCQVIAVSVPTLPKRPQLSSAGCLSFVSLKCQRMRKFYSPFPLFFVTHSCLFFTFSAPFSSYSSLGFLSAP